MDNIKKNFKNPTSEYRSAPFWSWNDVMDGEELARQLRDFKAHGMGGAFAHPRVGMVTEYLSEEYFEAWRAALEAVKEEDMKLYLYDENSWPSLMAGGLVCKKDPDTIPVIAKYRVVRPEGPNSFPGPIFYAAVFKDNALGMNLTDIPFEKWGEYTSDDVIVFYQFRTWDGIWHGNCPMPDLTNPRTTELFLELTYEEYYKRFGEDFGTYIPASFSDETNFSAGGGNTAPFSVHVRKRFKELNGYEFAYKYLPCIFMDAEGVDTDGRTPEKIRYDYLYTLHELWMDNFVKPIAKWCEDHNIAWTGHDCEHAWPQSFTGFTPGEMTTYEYRQWPGFDLLLCDHLRDTPANFDRYLMCEIKSAANQFGCKRTLCEAYGAGGYHSTMEDYKRLGDYIMVGGINLMCQHLALYSYIGSAKRDCPQSFDYRQPWWNEYTDMANYFARTSYILSQGKMEQRIVLLNPYTASYTVAGDKQIGRIDHGLSVDCIKNPDMSDFLTAFDELTDNQWEFDIADEFSMSRRAKVEGKLFKVGNMAYETVVVSKNMTGMRRSTVKLLCEFAEAGGRIILTDGDRSSIAEYIEGEKGCPETEAVRALGVAIDGADKLCAYLERVHEKRLLSSTGWKHGVQHMRRVLDDGRVVYYIVNHSMGTFETCLTLKGEDVCAWDLYTGETKGLPYEKGDGCVSVPLKLERCGAALLVTGDGAAPVKAKAEACKPVALERVSIAVESENMFNIDHVSLECEGVDPAVRYFLDAREKLFKAMGYKNGLPWNNIQEENKWMDSNADFDESSAFSVQYPFTITEGVLPTKLWAVVERPELWHVLVNGVEVRSMGQDELDRGMGKFDISDFVKTGENVITLHADKFNVLCEIEAVLIRGDFAVVRGGKRFVIAPQMAPVMGDFADFGRRFYQGAVNYTYKATLEGVPESAKIALGKYGATVVSATVNGEYAGFIGMEGGHSLDVARFLKAGENEIVLRVCASLRNLYGPHVEYTDTIPYEWIFERDREYTADEYTFSEYGLFEDATLTVS